MREVDVYSVVGPEGFGRLVAAFYRQDPKMISWHLCTQPMISVALSNACEIF